MEIIMKLKLFFMIQLSINKRKFKGNNKENYKNKWTKWKNRGLNK